jgi:hypothetical protein
MSGARGLVPAHPICPAHPALPRSLETGDDLVAVRELQLLIDVLPRRSGSAAFTAARPGTTRALSASVWRAA